ncbi:MAG: GNAT family N-acetyltransferase [Gemmatimonadota bacterium]|nr:GNAT family N-acetyltransferase [Gemmatimonadota bacterium]
MTTDVRVRRATLEDLDELVALWVHYMRVHRANPAYRLSRTDGLIRRRQAFEKLLKQPDACVFIVPRPDGGLDGMLTCFVEANTPYFNPPRYGRLQTPFVRPEVRGRGYIRMLLAAAYEWAREHGLSEIRLITSACDPTPNRRAEELGFEAFEIVRRLPMERSFPAGRTPFDEERS